MEQSIANKAGRVRIALSELRNILSFAILNGEVDLVRRLDNAIPKLRQAENCFRRGDDIAGERLLSEALALMA